MKKSACIVTSFLFAWTSLVQAAMPNIEAEHPEVNYRAKGKWQHCQTDPQAPPTPVTFSGLGRIDDNRLLFVRDTKNCDENGAPYHWNELTDDTTPVYMEDLADNYFGILERSEKGQYSALKANKVSLQAGVFGDSYAPSDLESFCIYNRSENAFTLIAAESWGYKRAGTRFARLFRVRFNGAGSTWTAKVTGIGNFGQLLEQQGIPYDKLDVEALLCSRIRSNSMNLTLVDRGKPGQDAGYNLGFIGLKLKLSDDGISLGKKIRQWNHQPAPVPACTKLETRAGSLREVSAVFADGDTVWAVASFEGSAQYCSVIYQLCGRADCTDTRHSNHASPTILRCDDLKVEGLTGAMMKPDGSKGPAGLLETGFAIATDEETRSAQISDRYLDCQRIDFARTTVRP